MRVADKIKRKLRPHYLIIGHYTGEVIGCTRGKSGNDCTIPSTAIRRWSARTPQTTCAYGAEQGK